MTIDSVLGDWLKLANRQFSRQTQLSATSIQCDCSGLVNLLFEKLKLSKPFGLDKPRAVHYFSILQEIGSNRIEQVKPGHLMAWRKDNLPKSGDSGHVLLVAGVPAQVSDHVYRLSVVDATKLNNGLAQREIRLHVSEAGKILGVQLHLLESKVKHCSIYHAPLQAQRYCFGCGVPKRVCLCGQISVSRDTLPLVVLRHPHERKQTLSTVSLIKQRYPNVLVKEGEIFDKLRLNKLSLIFPQASGEPENQAVELQAGSNILTGETAIVLDATWRKAKRMLHENPWLAELPRICIQPAAISDYLIRKVPNAQALSTVEIVALTQGDEALQRLFTIFMQKQIEVMGKDVYENNYQDFINYSVS